MFQEWVLSEYPWVPHLVTKTFFCLQVEASYYYNRLTGEATWIKPEGFDAEEYDKLGTTIGSNNSWDEGAINEVDPWPDEKK